MIRCTGRTKPSIWTPLAIVDKNRFENLRIIYFIFTHPYDSASCSNPPNMVNQNKAVSNPGLKGCVFVCLFVCVCCPTGFSDLWGSRLSPGRTENPAGQDLGLTSLDRPLFVFTEAFKRSSQDISLNAKKKKKELLLQKNIRAVPRM